MAEPGPAEGSRRSRTVHLLLKIAGFAALLVGLLGLILPVIPGIPLIFVGLLILGEESIVSGWIIKRLPAPLRDRIRGLLRSRKDAQDSQEPGGGSSSP